MDHAKLKEKLESARTRIEQLENENRRLKDQRDRLREFPAYSDVTIILDDKGKVRSLRGGPGTKTEGIEGTLLLELVSDEDRSTTEDFINNPFEKDLPPVKFETLFQDAARWLKPIAKTSQTSTLSSDCENEIILHFRDVTEKKKFQSKLEESRQRQWQIIDLLPNIVYARDREGKFVFANEALAQLYDEVPKHLIGKKVENLSKSGLPDSFLEDDLEVLKSGTPESTTENLSLNPGDERVMETKRIPYYINSKDKDAVLVVTTDITEKEEAKEALNRERVKLKKLHDAVDRLKRQNSEADLLQSAVEMAENILDFEICAVALIEGDYLVTKALSTGLGEDETIKFEIGEGIAGKTVQKGETIWGKDVSNFPEAAPTDEDFKAFISVPIGELGNFQVISKEFGSFNKRDVELAEVLAGHIESELLRLNYEEELVETKQELEKSREKYRRLVENQGEGIISTDLNKNIVFANPAAARTLGYEEPEEITNKKITDYLDQDQAEFIKEEIRKRLEGEISTYEIDYSKPGTDEDRVILVTAKPRRDEDGNIIGSFAILRDVTERVRAQRELKELNERMREMTRMVAHELRTPLTTIRGYADMMSDGVMGEISEEQEEMLNKISKSSRRLSSLVKNFLDLEKMEAGKLDMGRVQLNLGDLLEETVEQYENRARKKGLEFRSSIEDRLPVRGDRQKLSRVFSNIVSNAIKFTGSGNITVSGESREERVKITVEDEGVGIAESELDQIFEKFYRAESSEKSSANGSGLGLTFVKKVVEAHEGTIEVYSKLNEGTEFIIYLPLSEVDR